MIFISYAAKMRVVLIFSGILFIWSCTNPFSSRADKVEKPEIQTPGSGYDFTPAINPDIVFLNFEKSIAEKNIEEYMRCFVPQTQTTPPGFYFEADPYYGSEFENRPWTLFDERNYFTQLTVSGKGVYPILTFSVVDTSISWRPITPTSVNDSVETNNFRYQLLIRSSLDSTAVFQGYARFKLFKSKTPPETWHIYFWQDLAFQNQHKKSWTFLKLLYRKKS